MAGRYSQPSPVPMNVMWLTSAANRRPSAEATINQIERRR
jgi:hypothetical protein